MEDAGLAELKEKLAEEEKTYAELLARLDSLSTTPTPYAFDPDIPSLLKQLNEVWDVEAHAAPSTGLKGRLRTFVRKLVEPEIAPLRESVARQRSFNSLLVQFLNRFSEAEERRAARLSEFRSVLVSFSQRIDRLADAKDRLYATLGATRTDLLLAALDKRLETVALGLKRAESRLEGLLTSVDLARTEIRAAREPAANAPRPAPLAPSEYVSFENRYRGSREEIRDRLGSYVPYFRGQAPVLELGSGRGEFLELLAEDGIEARGVDDNAEMVARCRERGLAVEAKNLVTYVAEIPSESVGGIFAAQVIEHLPPPLLRSVLADCYRSLRKGGRLVVETVNPRSVIALVESFHRDLTHQKPLHPETVDFLLRACGFRDVEIQYRSPVAERAKLVPLPLSDDSTHTLNENFRKLNAFLFGEQDYAAIANK